MKKLKIDAGIPDALKVILSGLGTDIRKELIDRRCAGELPDVPTMQTKEVAKAIQDGVDLARRTTPFPDSAKAAFKALYVWVAEHGDTARDLFGDFCDRAHVLRSDEENAADIRLADVARQSGVASPEHLADALGMVEMLKSRGLCSVEAILAALESARNASQVSDRGEQADQEDAPMLRLLKEQNIRSTAELRALLQAKPEMFQHISQATLEKYLKFMEMLDRSKNRVRRQLEGNGYDCSGWQVFYPPTIIEGITKGGVPIPVVVRPSDGGYIITFYEEEPEVLSRQLAELWCDDGRSAPSMVTLGRVLGAMKRRSLDKIWLE